MAVPHHVSPLTRLLCKPKAAATRRAPMLLAVLGSWLSCRAPHMPCRVWNLRSGSCVHELHLPDDDDESRGWPSVHITPDGKTAVTMHKEGFSPRWGGGWPGVEQDSMAVQVCGCVPVP